jgi:hypothetical protein
MKSIEKTKDNNYINVIFQPDVLLGANNTPLTYDKQLTIPLLDRAGDYYVSVIRFALPVGTIPIFKWAPDVTQNNPNKSNWIIGIRTLGLVDFPQYVIYQPQNNYTVPVPQGSAPFFTSQQLESPYFDIFSINQVILMINNALIDAVVASAIGTSSPFYTYNPSTQLITLTVEQDFIDSGAKIFVNTWLVNYLDSFEFMFDTTPRPLGYYYFHVLSPAPFGQTAPYIYTEEYIAMALWISARRIYLTTSSLPINTESVPSQNSSTGVINGGTTYQAILTDFILNFESINSIKTVAYYSPTSQYRLIDMNGESPISTLNLNFYYQDKFGNTYQMFLSPDQQASVKLGFFNKNLYRGSKLLFK